MKLKTEQDMACNDIEVTVKYAKKDRRVRCIIDFLQSIDMQIKCDKNNAETMINVSDIYYIESIDKRIFVYLEKEVYHTEFRLYQLSEELKEFGFVQVSKSCILNINVLESLKTLFNSRMEATLKNGEKVYINRNYLNDVKKALKGDNEV